MKKYKLFNRELSWLSFNYRVLQEAKNSNLPLYERLKFLAIFSSNLDEFFRVRVASLRSLLVLKQKQQKELKFNPEKLIYKVHKTVNTQQEEFGSIYRNIISDLKQHRVYLVNETELNDVQKVFVNDFFEDSVKPLLTPVVLTKDKTKPFLQNGHLYFAVELFVKYEQESLGHYGIVEIPSDQLPRFMKLPTTDERTCIIFLDDIIKLNLPKLFQAYDVTDSFSIKLTRDAELYIDDEFSGDLLEKIKKGLKKRASGVPCRFLYDQKINIKLLKYLQHLLDLEKEDLVPGSRYHNFSDFFTFPNPGFPGLNNPAQKFLEISSIEKSKSIFEVIKQNDRLLIFPYHKYDYVLKLFEDATEDPNVYGIKITQYRVARNSSIVKSLHNAANENKNVTAFVEVKARFDEEANIRSADEMKNTGVKVLYSFPGIKVHAKLALINRFEGNKKVSYCYLATGNFNENTSKIYTDFGFMTCDARITKEVEKVFELLERNESGYHFKHLLVSQYNMRNTFYDWIDKEIVNAQSGKEAYIHLKLNSLEDSKMIKKLYEANNAGVKIKILNRGICRLIPGIDGMSENIEIRSIVDKFLEHARIYIFCNGGDEKLYLGSADWMKRNLSRRIEVAFPIYDDKLRGVIKKYLELQFDDNVKSRIIDSKQTNQYYQGNAKQKIRAQEEIYKLAAMIN